VKNKNYLLQDFLLNIEFIRWVKSPDSVSNLYWHSWLNAHPEHKEVVEEARRLLLSIQFNDPEQDASQLERVLEQVLKKSQPLKKKSDTRFWNFIPPHRIYDLGRVAAVLFFILVFSFLIKNHQEVVTIESSSEISFITKTNPRGKRSSLILPDSTRVFLNAESSVKVPSDYIKNRTIELSGEAFFDVRPSSSSLFKVKSQNVTITALGTAFSVKAYKEDVNKSVMLKKGKVLVETTLHSNITSTELIPGEKLTCNEESGSIKKSEYDVNKEFAWTEGVLIFHKTDLEDFIKTLERWYNVKVLIEGRPSDSWRINGRFDNELLENVLESLRFAREIDYDLSDDVVTIKFMPM
jgi:transmembrane sensor